MSSQRGKLASLSINTNLSNPTITNLTNPPRAQDSAGTMAASKSLRRSTHVRELGRKSSRDGVADRRGSDPNRGQPKSLVSAPRFTGSTQEAGDQSHPTEGGDVTMPPNAGDYPSTRWKNSNTHEENRHPQSKRTSQTYVVPNSASSTSSFDQLPRRYKSSSNMSHASSNDTSLMSPTNDDSGAHPAPPVDAQSFFKSAAERHSVFIDRESRANSDRARVELFAEFIVTESRIRRDRYATAIDSMGTEILELTRDLFRPQDPRRRFASPIDSVGSDWTKDSPDDRVAPQSIEKSLKRRRVIIPIRRSGSNEPSSGDSPASGAQHDASVAEKYRPTLSPIAASMISDAHDEMSSRGRQTVRWWESSQDGSSHNGGGTRGVERSKRESKYMGVNREEMELLQYAQSGPANYPAQYASYGVNEYPAEKQGSHEEDHSSLPTPQAPSTPKQVGLDISRLITLPPPYPRHHPAINNKHPDLAEIRNKARALGGPSELSDRLKAFTSELTEKHIANKKASAGRKARHLTDIRRQVELGEMSYAGAARAEADFGAAEELRAKQQPQQDFNDYQTAVLQDLHKLLTDRLAEACKPFDSLRREINSDAKAATANRPQEEGDERPELLEKLTLLKWLFDVREGLHAQLHALLSDRNDRYRHVILAQYAGAENAEKHGETEAFFAKDARDARVKHETEALARLQALVATVDKNVTHGADMNLSAFWDIAPGLNELCDQIPAASTRALRSSDFKLQIPAEERAENPAYERFPLQYLHSLLEHASRSAYQYIEAQVNLLCLLHEVKSGLSAARARLLEARRAEGGAGSEEGDEGRREREREERESKELTRELQEKVQMVEEQWREALGEKMRGIERQVRRALEEQGGWDEDREV